MFFSQKILKPDVPPRRRRSAPGFLGRLLRLLPFIAARHSAAPVKPGAGPIAAATKRYRGQRA